MSDRSLIIRSVHYVDGGDDDAKAARATHKGVIPSGSARRMTHLGMLVGVCLQKLDLQERTPIIYASAFAESASLEAFIDSFPQASPMLFQTSIHPSAVEQALIPRRQAVRRFYPITSDFNLAGKALENATILADDDLTLVAGEERGGWLCPHGLASDTSFAVALSLTRSGEGIGRIRLEPAEDLGNANGVGLPALFAAARDRSPLTLPSYALSSWIHLEWK